MDFRQSKLWAKYLQSVGWKIERLDGDYVYIYPILWFGYAIRIIPSTKQVNFKKIDQLAKKYAAIFVRLEFNIFSYDRELADQLIEAGFQHDPWSIKHSASLTLDLTQSKNKLFSDMNRTWRNSIYKAQKTALKISSGENIDLLIDIWQKNGIRKGILPEAPTETKKLWQLLSQQGKAQLFFAKFHHQTVAAALVIFGGNYAHLSHLCYNGQHPEIESLRMLVWKIILSCKARGMRKLDLGDPSSIFKRGVGGKEKRLIGWYIKYYHPLFGPLIRLATHLKPDLILKIYRHLQRFTYG